jgi:hypothetical protein
MQARLLLSLLVAVPLIAQETAQPAPDAKKDEVTQTAQETNQATAVPASIGIEPWQLTFIPDTMQVEFSLIKAGKTVDKTAWAALKKMTTELEKLLKNKKFEEAALVFDRINSSKPEGVTSIITVDTSVRGACVQARVCYSSAKEQQPVKRDYSCTMCEITRANTTPEVWKEITKIALETVKANQELSYDQAKQLAFTIAAKS